MGFLKRWKLTVRTNRGIYDTRYFFRRSKAEKVASEFKLSGLGHVNVTRR